MTTHDAPRPEAGERTPWAEQHPLLTSYYDSEWGMPVRSEQGVFERLSLEGFQAGLSWLTVLRKRDAFRAAFDGFDPEKVARFDAERIAELLGDASIIRNRQKIAAVIANARATLALREHEEGDLAVLVWSFMPERSPATRNADELPSVSTEAVALTKALKRHGFSFVGPTTVYAMMAAIGIVDLHVVQSPRRGCSGLWNRDGTRKA